jgi:hypothetical protein
MDKLSLAMTKRKDDDFDSELSVSSGRSRHFASAETIHVIDGAPVAYVQRRKAKVAVFTLLGTFVPMPSRMVLETRHVRGYL